MVVILNICDMSWLWVGKCNLLIFFYSFSQVQWTKKRRQTHRKFQRKGRFQWNRYYFLYCVHEFAWCLNKVKPLWGRTDKDWIIESCGLLFCEFKKLWQKKWWISSHSHFQAESSARLEPAPAVQIVAPLVVIGSLLVGLLMAMLIYKVCYKSE